MEEFDNLWDQAFEEEKAKEAFLRKLGIEDINMYQNYVFVAVTKRMFNISNININT